jgi:hypothetical protein
MYNYIGCNYGEYQILLGLEAVVCGDINVNRAAVLSIFFFVALHLKNDNHLCNTLSWEYQNFNYVKIKTHTRTI